MPSLSLFAPPEVEPVELDEAKKHARIFIDSDDVQIAEFITAARDKLEKETGQYFAEQTFEWSDVAAATVICLPLRPVIDVVSVVDGDEQTVDDETYTLTVDRFGHGTIEFSSVPSGPLTIQFSVGYATVGDPPVHTAPPLAKLAIKSLVSHWYNFREAYVASANGDIRAVPASYLSILQNFR